VIEGRSLEGELEGLKAGWVLTSYSEEYQGVSDGMMQIYIREDDATVNPMDIDAMDEASRNIGGDDKSSTDGERPDKLPEFHVNLSQDGPSGMSIVTQPACSVDKTRNTRQLEA
jgi:hypothetical protein